MRKSADIAITLFNNGKVGQERFSGWSVPEKSIQFWKVFTGESLDRVTNFLFPNLFLGLIFLFSVNPTVPRTLPKVKPVPMTIPVFEMFNVPQNRKNMCANCDNLARPVVTFCHIHPGNAEQNAQDTRFFETFTVFKFWHVVCVGEFLKAPTGKAEPVEVSHNLNTLLKERIKL